MPSFRLWLLCFCTGLGLLACRNAEPVQTTAVQEAGEPELVFLNYRIYRKGETDVRVELENTIRTPGKLKKAPESPEAQHGDFLCVQQAGDGSSLAELTVPNPLVQLVEYVNDSGHFERKRIELDSTDCPLRLQLHPQAEKIQFQWFRPDRKKHLPLHTVNL